MNCKQYRLLTILILMLTGCDSSTSSGASEEALNDQDSSTTEQQSDAGNTSIDLMDSDQLDMGATELDLEVEEEPEEDPERLNELFQWNRLLRVEIELPSSDWESLRSQRLSFTDHFWRDDCLDQPFRSPYSWFEASVTLDGEHFPRVDLRKKGFIGSVSYSKPGLKLDLGEYVDGQNYMGARRITLNNSRQDPSLIRQCLGYELIAQAGYPSPRCNFAHVTVNGEVLGLYVNIETYKRPLLERLFSSAEGNLYEGTISDFTDRAFGTFEAKNNDEERLNFPDLVTALRALEANDEQLIDQLESIFSLDEFYSFWALEALLGHWDGYTGNRNNFYLYGDPMNEGKFRFLFWGLDGILVNRDEELSSPVFLGAQLPWRLYQLDEGRVSVNEELDLLLSSVWDEDLIIQRIEELRELVLMSSDLEEEKEEADEAIDELIEVVENRRAQLEAARTIEEENTYPEPDGPSCMIQIGSVSGSFSTEWGSINQDPATWFADESTAFSLAFDNQSPTRFLSVGVAAGTDETFGPRLNLVGNVAFESFFLLNVSLAEESWRSGEQELWSEIYYRGFETGGEIVYIVSARVTLSLSEASTEDNAPIIGTLEGSVIGWDE